MAAAAEETGDATAAPFSEWRTLDTDLPLPPEALEMTRTKLDDPRSNSWLPFTGDLDLRAAISDFTAERSGHRYDLARSSSRRRIGSASTSSSAPLIPETR